MSTILFKFQDQVPKVSLYGSADDMDSDSSANGIARIQKMVGENVLCIFSEKPKITMRYYMLVYINSILDLFRTFRSLTSA